jgi:DNA-binding Lrp family transcriptional regulator
MASFVSTSGFHPLFGDCSREVVRRRLRKLEAAGLVLRHQLAVHEEAWFTITRAGAREVARAFGLDLDDLHVPRNLCKNLGHHASGAWIHICAMVAATKSHHVDLVTWAYEREIRASVAARHGGRVPPGAVFPDCVAVFERFSERVAWAVEVDTGSEAMRTIRSKLMAYQSAAEAGAPLWGTDRWVVTFVVDAPRAVRRRNKIASCAYEECDEEFAYVTTREVVSDANILTPTPWVTPRLTSDGSSARLVQEGPWGVATPCSGGVLSRAQQFGAGSPSSKGEYGPLPVRPFPATQVTK